MLCLLQRDCAWEPLINDLGDLFFVPVRHPLGPLDYVDTITKVTYRAAARDELEKDNSKAINIAFLVHPKGICILCSEKEDGNG